MADPTPRIRSPTRMQRPTYDDEDPLNLFRKPKTPPGSIRLAGWRAPDEVTAAGQIILTKIDAQRNKHSGHRQRKEAAPQKTQPQPPPFDGEQLVPCDPRITAGTDTTGATMAQSKRPPTATPSKDMGIARGRGRKRGLSEVEPDNEFPRTEREARPKRTKAYAPDQAPTSQHAMLRQQVLEDLKGQGMEELRDEIRRALEARPSPESRRQVMEELRRDCTAELRRELRKEVELDVSIEARHQFVEELTKNTGQVLRTEIRKELRKELYDEIEAQIRAEYAAKWRRAQEVFEN
ncbi:MAG: hypothetical protein L6R39_004003 [Caloplaca ligustica]|nr:MAG: hypothetical protein L6R39_004003 [Caloplaca ligustica]